MFAQDNPTASRLPWVIVGLGLAGLVLLVTSDRIRQRSVESHLTQLQSIERVQFNVALSHLWIEEYLTGDLVAPSEIFGPIEEAQRLLRALLAVTPSDSSAQPHLTPLDKEERRGEALELQERLAAFERISRERSDAFSEGKAVGIGSVMDVRYDGVFTGVLDAGQRLDNSLERDMAAHRRSSNRIFLAVVGLWSLLILATAWLLRQRERHRTRTMAELAASRSALQRSQKLDALGRMAGGLAHDLNNYLAAVRGHCELARMKLPEDHPARTKLDDAVRVTSKAARLVERLLTFSYSQPSDPEVVAPNQAIRSIESVFQPSIQEVTRMETRLSESVWNVEIDADGFQQALLNLLMNARDAMPRGGTVTVETRNLPEWGRDGGVSIAVTDTGTGIAPEVRDSLFEPFLTTKAESGGYGLGLSVVQQIIEGAGGTILVDSKPGKGARFEIQLPRTTAKIDAIPQLIEEAGVDLQGEERILLVDDNAEYRSSIEQLLTSLGYRVTTAVDGTAALDACESTGYHFDLVVTDLVMPDMSGRELVDRIAARTPVRALLLSAHGERELSQLGIHTQGVRLLHKLAPPLELAAALRAALEQEDALDE